MRQPVYVLCLLPFGVLGAPLLAAAQPPGHDFHTAQRDQTLYVSCRLNTGQEPVTVEVPLEIPSPGESAQLDQVIELPVPLAPIRLKQYLPRAMRDQSFIPGEGDGTVPAIEISIDGTSQSHRQWLVADDPERNRLISLIASWRYMAVADKGLRKKLYVQFEREFTREPTLLVSKPDGTASRELPAKPDSARTLKDLGCRISIRDFFPHFGIDRETGKPKNLSEKRTNPAALVEIELDGEKEQRWVFAKFPDFGTGQAKKLPLRIRLDCPSEMQGSTPDFALVTVGRDKHELWGHEGAKSTAKAIGLNEAIQVPGARYTFHIARFVPSGHLVEEYVPTEEKSGVAVLQIASTDASGSQAVVWLEKGKKRIISTGSGPMEVSFGPRRAGSSGGQKWPH